MRAAVIDIGSNSTKLVIGEKDENTIRVLESLKSVIGIGKNTFEKGRISQETFNQVIEVLGKFKKLIQEYEVAETKVIATTAVREAENRDVFIDTVQRKTGFNVEVLNVGDVVYFIDAFLSYKLEKKYPINERNVLIAEIGAGSLDISILEKGLALQNIGIPLGTLRLKQFKNSIDGSNKEIYEAIDEFVDNEITNLKNVIGGFKLNDIVLIDESYSSVLGQVIPSKTRDQNFFPFQYREAKQILSIFTQCNLDDLSEKYKIPTHISETFDGYAMIITKLFKLIKKKTLYILQTSLSEALLANIIFEFDIARKYNKNNQLISVTKFIGKKFGTDLRHVRQVASLSEDLFNQLYEFLGLKQDNLLFLQLAAYLHEIGLMVNNRSYHKHSEYIINALNLFRLTAREIRCIACIARYHRKAHPQKNHFIFSSLSLDEQLLVQKLSAILRVAAALDVSRKQKVKKCEVQFEKNGEIAITVHTQSSFILEKVVLSECKQLFEEVSGAKIELKIKQLH